MYEIRIIKNGELVWMIRTYTYVLAATDPDTHDPITKKDGDAALTIFLDMVLFAEAVGYLEKRARLRARQPAPGAPEPPPPPS